MKKYILFDKQMNGSSSKVLLPTMLLLFIILLNPALLKAQDHTIKGRVVDSRTEEPLAGVTILVKEYPTLGIATDFDGYFTLNIPKNNVTLRISYLGYKAQELKLSDIPTSITRIKLVEDNELNEVQIVAYGVQKKVTVTGAISSISGDDLLKSPTASITNALSGKVTGLSSVQYSGEPGADAADILIRGVTTMNNSSPLIQVDGVERDLSQIDPNEVESITVLKDASATAVFGIRGANGVILVTTKRGSEGKARISVSTSMGVQVPTRLLKFTNSYQYASYYNEAQINDGVPASSVKFTPDILQAFKDHSNPVVYPDIDWMDYILKKSAFQSQHNVNISGGTNNLRYFVSVGAFTQGGLFKDFGAGYDLNFDFKRYNYRANLDFDVSKSTVLSLNIGGRVEDKNTPIGTDGDQSQFFRRLYWSTPFSGAGIIDGKWIVTNPDDISEPGSDALSAYYGRGNTKNVSNNLEVDLMLEQKLNFITQGLSFKIKGSYNSVYNQVKHRAFLIPSYTPILKDKNNPSLGYDLRKSGDDSMLGYGEGFGKGRNWYFESSFNYYRSFGDHNVGGLILYNQSKTYYPKDNTEKNIYEGIPMGYVGLVGRATYDYKNKYMAEFNIGYNGSENFARDIRYDIFPAISAGWVVTEEKFMENIKKYVSYFKLRASYGKVGNDKMGDAYNGWRRFMYISDPYYLFGNGYNFGTNVSSNRPGSGESGKNNSLVTWESSYKQNYGLDFYTLDDRLKYTLDVFKEHREDILIEANTIPGIIGIPGNLPPINSGVVDSHGYEMTLGWEDKIGNDFRYWIRGNISFARNKVIEMDEVRQNEEYLYRTGKRVGQPIIRKFWGFFDETANERYKLEYGHDIASHPGGLKPGDAVFVDLNNDGIIDEDDRTALGYTNNPEYVSGINIGFIWKGFDFSMQWNGAWNSSRILDETFRDPLGETNNRGLLLDHFEGRWTPENAENAKWPRATLVSKKQNTITSSLYLVNANYIRLKNMEVGYTFNFPWLKKAKVTDMRIYVNGYNLLTFDKLKISDPESRTSDRPEYPLMRVYNIGLKVGF